MKKTSKSLLFPFLFFAIFVGSSLLSEAISEPDPVLDTRGKKLRADTTYMIAPPVIGRGGAITALPVGNKTCPYGVLQNSNEVQLIGEEVIFYPVDSKKGVVRLSTDLNIEFAAIYAPCDNSDVWKVDSYDRQTGNYFIMTGGFKGNPGPKTLTSWFKIEKYRSNYKIMYCPTVCKNCGAMCRNVGVVVQNGQRRLALSDVPLEVTFIY